MMVIISDVLGTSITSLLFFVFIVIFQVIHMISKAKMFAFTV
jgi:hypothetical protein